MLSRSALIALLSVLTVGSAVITTACTSDSDDDSNGESEEEVRARSLAKLGAQCGPSKKCQTGLTCKSSSSGPPPGAMGLPLPSSGGPPPGAMGLPNPYTGTCAKPAPGEQDGSCDVYTPCQPGLVCEYPSSGPPPGAVGLPQPGTSSGGPPPGAMGLPQPPRQGTCKAKSSGPPPGAMGLPYPQK